MTPYQQGIAHFQSGDYELALINFNAAIRDGYQPLEAAYYERSKCYEALGKIEKAKADLAHMLTLPISRRRRKQITNLMTLLDSAGQEVAPFKSAIVVNETPWPYARALKLMLSWGLMLLTSYFCYAGVAQINEIQSLEHAHQIVEGQVIRKYSGTSGKRQTPYYRLDYQYAVKLPNGKEQLFQAQQKVPKTVYNNTGKSVTIIYAIANPSSSRVMATFNPSNEYYNLQCNAALLIFFLIFVVGAIYSPLNQQAMAQQLVDRGRITRGVISNKGTRAKGTVLYHYRYYGYEGSFASVGFDVGDSIKVRYLPDNPHISKLHYGPLVQTPRPTQPLAE